MSHRYIGDWLSDFAYFRAHSPVGGMVLPKALLWIVIAYVSVVTIVAFVIRRPLIRLSYFNELRTSNSSTAGDWN
ncbi:hypothetical protein [Mycolicibacterium gadium]|uniref:Uncharacterized protein n=1 Tax=Mycolicibacterium gadium TaxID=1794 RepID=A0ABT6GPJ1_MYCGU|nr:hypothetical protein [Mycolicibacterium gadium]MDG5483474.1 hypothetical protein [Mycolicibacterium gadium]